MSDRQALIEVVRANPEEDTPRLVLADWYEENGDPARGEFVRVQCELASLDPASDRYPNLHVRQLQLLAEHEREWLGEWADRLVRWEFRRGVLDEVTIQPEPFCRDGAALFRDHPVWRVAFVDDEGESLAPPAIRDVLTQPQSRHLRAIDAAACRPGEQAAAMFGGQIHTNDWLSEIARATGLDSLRELSLYGGNRSGRVNIDLKVWQQFCAADHLRRLTYLDVSNWYDHGSSRAWESWFRVLAGASFTPELRSLRFEGCNAGAKALAHLIRTRRFTHLRALTGGGLITDNSISSVLAALLDANSLPALHDVSIPFGDYLVEFMDHPGWGRIAQLRFVGNTNPVSRDGSTYRATWRAVCRCLHLRPSAFLVSHYDYDPALANFWDELCGASWFPGLTSLTVDVGDYDCAPLFNRSLERFPMLRSLQLSPSTAVLQSLATWPGLANLVELGLNDNYGSTAPESTAKLFATSCLSPRLSRLRVSGICTSPEAVAAIAGCSALTGLTQLDFAFNALSPESAAALAASPYLKHLKSLHSWSEWDEHDRHAWLRLADAVAFPQLRDVVVGSATTEVVQQELRRRFGPRLRVFADC